MTRLFNALRTNHHLLSQVIHLGNTVIDATMGNGNDTLFLANLVGTGGVVHAFDIQEQAIINTTNKLKEANALHQCQLHHIGHEHLHHIIGNDTAIHAATFNLGYLPRGNKSITTCAKTTIEALSYTLKQLVINGIITLVVYHGHEQGKIEKAELEYFLSTLPQHQFTVAKYAFLNQQNTPPELLVIERIH